MGTTAEGKIILVILAVMGCSVFILKATAYGTADSEGGNKISLKRSKRSAILYNIYTLDFFIELVEKIERQPAINGKDVQVVANYIRTLGYDSILWDQLCGTSLPLPDGVLNVDEKRVLTNMIKYSYDESSGIETGVVLTPSGETVAMGHVVTGICAGLNRDKSLSLNTWSPGATQDVDNLYAATIAYNLGESTLLYKSGSVSLLLGPTGTWSPNTECPDVYRLTNPTSKATDAEILGDIDGFLLGYILPTIVNRGVRLGQLLRMYYGSGLLYDPSYASCKRNSKFKSLISEEELFYQIEGFSYAFHSKYSSMLSTVKKSDIPSFARETTEKFYVYFDQIAGDSTCTTEENEEECELPANIVFLMDESGSIKNHNYDKEKTFVRRIIEAFDVSPTQARVAIVEYSTDARLSVALDEYGSKARLLCALSDLQYTKGWTHTAKALELVHDNILKPAIKNPATSTETVQLVIVLTDGKSNDQKEGALKLAVQNIKNDIKDLTMIAVGIGQYNLDELKLIATDPTRHVFTATNFDQLLELVATIRNKTCAAPVYMGLNFTDYGDTTEVVAYVSPNKARFFTLPAEYFFGLQDIYIDVLPQYGTVSVFASRITDRPGPDNYSLKVGPAGKGDDLQLHFTDLCAGYNSSDTCPPINIGIYGETSTLSCSEQECNLPNQIKFRIRRGTPNTTGAAAIRGLPVIYVLLIQLTLVFLPVLNI